MDGRGVSDGEDCSFGAEHAQVLVCHNAPEMGLRPLRQPLLQCKYSNSGLSFLIVDKNFHNMHVMHFRCLCQKPGDGTVAIQCKCRVKNGSKAFLNAFDFLERNCRFVTLHCQNLSIDRHGSKIFMNASLFMPMLLIKAHPKRA